MRIVRAVILVIILPLTAACGATYVPAIPTERPTITPTFTATASSTPGADDATVTATPTRIPATPTGGPSPTPLFGPTHTLAPDDPTPTRILNPNAPRIEFFTSDVIAVEPGSSLTLFWSTRGVDNAVIYRLDSAGQRSQLWNVAPDGNLTVDTRRSERGQVEFVLSVGEGQLAVQQSLIVPLSCPIAWFFSPAPDECPQNEAQSTRLIEQPFERGRMVYIAEDDIVYTLFNDGLAPAWVPFENRYRPGIDPESAENFAPPPERFQPLGILGFVWRGNDTVRNRLGLGIDQEFVYEGFVQTSNTASQGESLYISSADGSILQLLLGGDVWQIITPP